MSRRGGWLHNLNRQTYGNLKLLFCHVSILNNNNNNKLIIIINTRK